jgi:arabinofuranosyltransferase
LALVGVVANRTFLTWTSSGLETQMFNFFVTAWVAVAVLLPPDRVRTLASLSLAASLIALTRPDGLLFVAATIALGGLWARVEGWPPRRVLAALSPLLLVVAHVLWRRSFYGLWLPNTYYAKIGGIWPAAGFRYLLSFVLEYAFWLWGVLLLIVIAQAFRRGWTPSALRPIDAWTDRLGPVAVACTVALHIGYYTVKVGGDHFEYRVLSYLVPLAFLSFVRLLASARASAALALSATLTLVVASLPIPWVHWLATKDLTTRLQTHVLALRIAPRFPRVARPYVELFDDLQQWLIPRHVGMRHQEHKTFSAWLGAIPPRSVRPRPKTGFPVVVSGTPGMMFWDYPEINVLDTSGLNDAVIARTSMANVMFHKLAHDRVEPPGYIECFRPNVSWEDYVVHVFPRTRPLSADDIRRCETTAWDTSPRAMHTPPPQRGRGDREDGCVVSDRDMVAQATREGLERAVRLFAQADDATARHMIAEDQSAEVLPAGSVLCPLERRWLAGEVRVRVLGRDEPVWTLSDVLP